MTFLFLFLTNKVRSCQGSLVPSSFHSLIQIQSSFLNTRVTRVPVIMGMWRAAIHGWWKVSPVVSIRASPSLSLMFVCATKSFSSGLFREMLCYYRPTVCLFVFSFYASRLNDDYRRLIVYGWRGKRREEDAATTTNDKREEQEQAGERERNQHSSQLFIDRTETSVRNCVQHQPCRVCFTRMSKISSLGFSHFLNGCVHLITDLHTSDQCDSIRIMRRFSIARLHLTSEAWQ